LLQFYKKNTILQKKTVDTMQQVRKKDVSADFLESVRRELTFVGEPQRTRTGLVAPPPYHAFAENELFLRVPKFYKLPRLSVSQMTPVTHVPALSLGLAKTFQMDGAATLRPLQQTAVDSALARLGDASTTKPRGALLHMPCGYGKTRCAAFIIQKIGVVTLVLVANRALADQFEAALRELSRDIVTAKLPKPTVPLPEAHVIFGTLQSVYSRRYPAAYLAPVGLVVVDEAHHLAAASFAQAMCSLGSARVLGLTATPERRDGRENLIYFLTGATAFRHDRPPTRSLSHRTIGYEIPPGFGATPYGSIGERMQLLVRLAEIPARNEAIVEAIVESATRRGGERRAGIIVLAKLQAHLHGLADRVATDLADASLGFFTGEETPAERAVAATKHIIFATYDMAKEGLDIPRLDTLVLASPAESLVQCVGRILRECPGKQEPLLLDVDDRFRALAGENASRRRKINKIIFG